MLGFFDRILADIVISSLLPITKTHHKSNRYIQPYRFSSRESTNSS